MVLWFIFGAKQSRFKIQIDKDDDYDQASYTGRGTND